VGGDVGVTLQHKIMSKWVSGLYLRGVSMSGLIRGNLKDKIADNDRGWVIGYFTNPKHEFHEHSFEMQWADLRAGETKPDGPACNTTAKTMCILIDGHLRLSFRNSEETVVLREKGDFVYFPHGVYHYWEAVEPTVTMTLRWPSVRGDQEFLAD
jgi:hypothetical protein